MGWGGDGFGLNPYSVSGSPRSDKEQPDLIEYTLAVC